MILKDITPKKVYSSTAKAGQKQEHTVAFFLRRAFKDHQKVFVINDFNFTFNEESAQIDHLIIYPYGFIIIESKSITGEVKVNELGEWTRSFNNKWFGMASPIKQAELQQKLLKELLHEHRSEILPKLLGIKQQSFGMRCWDHICTVSSNTIINRDSMPEDISKKLVKTEFLVDEIENKMNLKNNIMRTLTFDTRPDFNDSELKSITSFLMAKIYSKPFENKVMQKLADYNKKPIEETKIQCKFCRESYELLPKHGRYGYFIQCKKCNTNTAMKIPCIKCHSKNTNVSKKKEIYTLSCNDCDLSIKIFG